MQNVLVIEDDLLQVEIAGEVLRSIGAKNIVIAKCVSEAKVALQSNNAFELLLLDLNMPDCDGVEFLEYLQSIRCDVPIIIVSGARSSIQNGAAQLGLAYGLNLSG